MTTAQFPIDDSVDDTLILCAMANANADDVYTVESDTVRFVGAGPGQIQGAEDETPEETPPFGAVITKTSYFIVAILCLINLLNYMDRFTVAGVLKQVISYYNISDAQAGLLQTVFICSYMVLSPIFGFLGDRYNRKFIMIVGIFFWSAITLASSFIPSNMFWLFMLMRGLVGIGEASYSTIAPTIIADLFVKEMRTKMLAVFYFAIPVGSGLGYIIGAKVAGVFGRWYWALRVTPVLGVICVFLIAFFVKEPERGAAEGSHLTSTSYFTDLRMLIKNKSFVFSTLGFTCVAFVAGALAWWIPIYMTYALQFQEVQLSSASVSLIFGVITCLAGFLGVGLGAYLAKLIKKTNPRGDPLVCAFGLLMCAPFLWLSVWMSRYNNMITWILIFMGETCLCLNWALVADILLYVVSPTRRSTAEAFQILLSHLLGDAGSPYLIGVVADTLRGSDDKYIVYQFPALQYSLYMCTFICVIGGFFFLMCALFVYKDKLRVERIIKGMNMNGNGNKEAYDDLLIHKTQVTSGYPHTDTNVANGGHILTDNNVANGGHLLTDNNVANGGHLPKDNNVANGGHILTDNNVANGGHLPKDNNVANGGHLPKDNNVANGGHPHTDNNVANGGYLPIHNNIANGGCPPIHNNVASHANGNIPHPTRPVIA